MVCALGDWFGGYALYVVDGRAHFTFARAADVLELATPRALGAGAAHVTVSYAFGRRRRRPGRMELSIDGAAVDAIAVEGMLPAGPPARRGGPAARLRQRLPGLAPLHPPAAVLGHGALRADRDARAPPARPGRRGAHRAARATDRPPRRTAAAGVLQVLGAHGAAGTGARSAAGRPRPPAGPKGARAVELLVAEGPQQGLEAGSPFFAGGRPSRTASPSAAVRRAPALARSISSARLGDAGPRPPCAASQSQPVSVAFGDVMEHDPDRPVLPGHRPRPCVLATGAGEGNDLGVHRGEVVGEGGRPLSRRRATPPALLSSSMLQRPGGVAVAAARTASAGAAR